MDFSSIKTKITFALFLLLLVIAIVTTSLTLFYFERKMKGNISESQAAVVILAANVLDDSLNIAQRALIASRGAFTNAELDNPAGAQRLLDSQVALHSMYDNGVFLLNRNGKIVARSPSGPGRTGTMDATLSRLSVQTLSSKKPVITNGYEAKDAAGHATITIAVPVLDSRNDVIGVLAGSLDLKGSNILTDAAGTRIGKTGSLYVVDSDRNIIIHPDKGRIMTKAASAGLDGLFAKGGGGVADWGITRNSQGFKVLSYFVRLKNADWVLGANYPVSEAYSSIYSARKYYISGAVAALLFAVLFTWVVISRKTAPLIDLTRHIQGIADRKTAQKPLPVTTGDEIGTLARAFNDLLADLGQQKRFYEDLVKCTAIPTFVIDSNHKVLVWNLACEELTGIRALDVLGTDGQMNAFYGKRMQTLADIAIDENFEELASRYDIISESLLIPNGWHAEGWIKDLNGHDRYILIETTPIYNQKRELVAAIECLQDITERAQMMEALKESEEKFKSIAEQVNVLLASQD